MATVINSTDTNGNDIYDVSLDQDETSITLKTANTYVDKNIVFNINTKIDFTPLIGQLNDVSTTDYINPTSLYNALLNGIPFSVEATFELNEEDTKEELEDYLHVQNPELQTQSEDDGIDLLAQIPTDDPTVLDTITITFNSANAITDNGLIYLNAYRNNPDNELFLYTAIGDFNTEDGAWIFTSQKIGINNSGGEGSGNAPNTDKILVGTLSDITPTEVYEAIMANKDIQLTYGSNIYTNAAISTQQLPNGKKTHSIILQAFDKSTLIPILVQGIIATGNNQWIFNQSFMTPEISTVSDTDKLVTDRAVKNYINNILSNALDLTTEVF